MIRNSMYGRALLLVSPLFADDDDYNSISGPMGQKRVTGLVRTYLLPFEMFYSTATYIAREPLGRTTRMK